MAQLRLALLMLAVTRSATLTGVSIADGTNGGLASNYTLTGGTHNFTVNRRVVGVSGTRLYDATTNAVASDLATHANLVGSQNLTYRARERLRVRMLARIRRYRLEHWR